MNPGFSSVFAGTFRHVKHLLFRNVKAIKGSSAGVESLVKAFILKPDWEILLHLQQGGSRPSLPLLPPPPPLPKKSEKRKRSVSALQPSSFYKAVNQIVPRGGGGGWKEIAGLLYSSSLCSHASLLQRERGPPASFPQPAVPHSQISQ